MPARLAAGMLVAALIRRTEAAGGHAMVIARGDPTAGALLIQLADRGVAGALLERTLSSDGSYLWAPAGPDEPTDRPAYLDRRRRSDPDLWILEVDAPDAHALVGEVAG
jgi:hypothetical protein